MRESELREDCTHGRPLSTSTWNGCSSFNQQLILLHLHNPCSTVRHNQIDDSIIHAS